MSSAPRSEAELIAELDRLREEVVRLQAKVDALEAAQLAAQAHPVRRGLGSLIPMEARG